MTDDVFEWHEPFSYGGSCWDPFRWPEVPRCFIIWSQNGVKTVSCLDPGHLRNEKFPIVEPDYPAEPLGPILYVFKFKQ